MWHAVTCNLDYVIFVAAGENDITYATLVKIPSDKRRNFFEILKGVYERTLKWAHVDAFEAEEIMDHIPSFRAEVLSTRNYPIDAESVAFTYAMWRLLMKKVYRAELPLPVARKIVPAIVSWWNRMKGRIDEMTRYLSYMNFFFSQCSPKQTLVMRELKKMVMSVFFATKHCFPSSAPPKGLGYSKVQSHLRNKHGLTCREILFALASSYTVVRPISGVPLSPKKDSSGKVVEEDHPFDIIDLEMSQRQQQELQRNAKATIDKKVRGKRKRFDIFCKDDELGNIRLDPRLHHVPASIGFHAKSKKSGNKKGWNKKPKYCKSVCFLLLCISLVVLMLPCWDSTGN